MVFGYVTVRHPAPYVAYVEEDVHSLAGADQDRRPRVVGLSPGAVDALREYLPLNLLRSGLIDGPLWWGKDGPLGSGGVYKAIKRIGERAGVEVHPHAFRHLFPHRWLDAQGGEQALMTVAGWRTSKMLARYGRGLAEERALRAHERLAVNW